MSDLPSPAPAWDPADIPQITLDPHGRDHHGEAARLRQAGQRTGGVVRVLLPDGLPAWALTTRELVDWLVRQAPVSKDYRNWTCYQNGQLSPDSRIIGMICVDNLVTADGPDHERLRAPITREFTARRVRALQPLLDTLADELLDHLPAHTDGDGQVDLRAHYAEPLPLRVIAELLGVPAAQHQRLRYLVDGIFRTDLPPAQVTDIQTGIGHFLDELIKMRLADPGEDLTSALIAQHEADPARLSARELADSIWVLATAGHETTIGLICNTVRAVLTHPTAREHARTPGGWARIIEEVLRWDSSIGNFAARYPTSDLTVPVPASHRPVIIPAGEAILAPYTAIGRCPQAYGPTADVFDPTRSHNPPHLAFGGGRHFCPGAALARTITDTALSALFTRFPHLRLAVPDADLPPVPSVFTNTVRALPVLLGTPLATTNR
ncbi:cytochrome P450 [Actinomadura kijaniata]|uniref:cytochrome P450 n=1 Tax=Actinomadura kijaniata TaxID=46161 RepID=UPI0008364CE2|nr:cytochrome P450 [Actinomadura kijaniata]